MSANKEKFPTPDFLTQPSELFIHYYFKSEVDGWFQRCMEDFPKLIEDYRVGGDGEEYPWDYYDIDEIKNWFEKWFSQFRNNKE